MEKTHLTNETQQENTPDNDTSQQKHTFQLHITEKHMFKKNTPLEITIHLGNHHVKSGFYIRGNSFNYIKIAIHFNNV